MRVFVAGATGAIGRPLVRQLRAAGHEVTGMTSAPERTGVIEADGGSAVVCDALDADATAAAVAAARPDVIVSQLTRLPSDYDPRTIDYGPTNRARHEGGRNLIAAALAAGTPRFVTQSIAFLYAPEGGPVKEESAAVWTDAPAPFGEGVERTVAHERDATGTAGLDGLVLRYGFFYGPSTWYSRDGSGAARIRRRRFPIVGRGEGIFSFIHVDDAAAATVAACERGDPGIYNVVDDEPAPVREWLPVLARELGAKRPLRAPAWLARIVAGPFATALARDLRGASNAKAKRELGFEPLYPSWRQGFAEGLG